MLCVRHKASTAARHFPGALQPQAMADLVGSLLAEQGVAGVVAQVRLAAQHGLAARATTYMAALTRVEAPNDVAALRAADGANVLGAALAAFARRGSALLAQCALGALDRAWATRGAHVPSAAVLGAVLDAMTLHRSDVLVAQCGLRLLRQHAAGDACVALAPRVAEVAGAAMRAHRADGTVQHWGAEVVCLLAGLEPVAVAKAHGALGEARLATACVAAAVEAGARPTTLLVGGAPWHAKVLATFPRLRERR